MLSARSEWEHHAEYESLRRVLCAELRYTTLGRLAKRLNVRPQALRLILRMGAPQLTDEQLQELDAFRQAHPAREPEPGAVAVSILVAGLPGAVRERTRASFVRQLHDAITAAGAPLPGWIEDELMAVREELAPTPGPGARGA